ncbi:MAG: aminotransferase class V-fold PLP-dependent enzyme [Bacteroidales bacterium]|jgi:cysteine desulfurase family protein|nr:aminotransferase class V-fold PLP-dependent enzyme [Bacteroidales bacterium]
MGKERLTYFDNSSTSFPKHKSVAEAICNYIDNIGGTYGRSFYKRSIDASSIVEDTRDKLAELLHTDMAENIVLCNNATQAINTVIKGFLKSGDHVLVSPLEHNAVMRPLKSFADRNNISWDVLHAHSDGLIDTEHICKQITSKTRLIIVNHVSNVNGLIQPIKEIKEAAPDVALLVDGAQSVGKEHLNCDLWDIDFAAFTGHKAIGGPTGTGGVYIKDTDNVDTLIEGGTGSNSEEIDMPDYAPDKFMAGTPNIVGFAGLLAALNNPLEYNHTHSDVIDIIDKIKSIEGLNVICANNPDNQSSLFSITHNSISSSTLSSELYSRFGIETRSGLHCAPVAHKYLKTGETGSCRLSLSPLHTKDDLEYMYSAIKDVVE